MILITLPLQQWLHERASMLSYTLFLQDNYEQHQDKLHSVYIIRRSSSGVKPRRSKKKLKHAESNAKTHASLKIVSFNLINLRMELNDTKIHRSCPYGLKLSPYMNVFSDI